MKKVVVATALGLIISTLPVASDSVAALSKTENQSLIAKSLR